jgi:ABC-type polysaccharide/polyol phosphate transport system ATPase subunit
MAWRDLFTDLIREPLDTIFPDTERLHVARQINFKIMPGERVGLIGVNGAGKTSLCRCISGMFPPTRGMIKRHVPVRGIFDTHIGIQPELTGRENAELLAHFLYGGRGDMAQLLNDAFEFSELGRFIDVPFKLYSNGMQARLCLSLVTARPAGLLILDEVFDGADVFFREKVGQRMMDLMQESLGVIFVSHAFDQIKRVCTRVLVLHQGKIIYDGAPEEAIAAFDDANKAAPALGHSLSVGL